MIQWMAIVVVVAVMVVVVMVVAAVVAVAARTERVERDAVHRLQVRVARELCRTVGFGLRVRLKGKGSDSDSDDLLRALAHVIQPEPALGCADEQAVGARGEPRKGDRRLRVAHRSERLGHRADGA